MSSVGNLVAFTIDKIDHFLLVAITLLVTSSQMNHVYLLKRSIEVICIFYGFQSHCWCSLSVYSSVCQIGSKVRQKIDSYRTSACSALCMTFPALTHSRGLHADIQWTRTEEYVTSVSRFRCDNSLYVCGIYGVITSLYVCLCIICSFRGWSVVGCDVCLYCSCRTRQG